MIAKRTLPGLLFLAALALQINQPVTAGDAADAAAIEKIDSAWSKVETEFDALLARNLKLVADGDATERYNAYKNSLGMTMDMYTYAIYRSSSRNDPEYLPFITPISNNCEPLNGTRYGVAYIEPGATYRVWGNIGNAADIDIQQWNSLGADVVGRPAAVSSKTFSAQGIKADKQGRYEFMLGPTKPANGQWWQLDDKVRVLMFRDYYLDYSMEATPPTYHLEKVGAKDKGPTAPTVDEAAQRLEFLAQAMKAWDSCFTFPGIPENRFTQKRWHTNPDDESSGHVSQADQNYYESSVRLEPGQALIVEWKPPADNLFWNIELGTRLGQNFNFGARQVDLSARMAQIDKDGMARIVVSHEDLGVANWLDLDGNKRALIWIRCKKCSDTRIPTTKLVETNQVTANLPVGTKMTSSEERQRQLDLRRRHYLSRYGL